MSYWTNLIMDCESPLHTWNTVVIVKVTCGTCGPGSVVGIATAGWTVRGSNPGGGEVFRTCPVRP
jgi:hypothetical protein